MKTRWIKTDKHVYGAIWREHKSDLKVFGTVTDPDGMYGSPLISTEWGFEDSDAPVIKAEERRGEWTYFLAAVSAEDAD